MSVNVSTRQLMSPGFTQTVEAVLAAAESDPQLMTLELTESVFIHDPQRTLMVLNDLKHLGVKLALDDFGTGYSSLSYLKKFPVDIVKIDRSFVTDLTEDPVSRTIVAAVIGLAHGLGMTVTAEGVETSEQHRHLTELGSDSCQGYSFAHPMTAINLDALIRNGTGRTTLHLPALATTTTDP